MLLGISTATAHLRVCIAGERDPFHLEVTPRGLNETPWSHWSKGNAAMCLLQGPPGQSMFAHVRTPAQMCTQHETACAKHGSYSVQPTAGLCIFCGENRRHGLQARTRKTACWPLPNSKPMQHARRSHASMSLPSRCLCSTFAAFQLPCSLSNVAVESSRR